MLWSDIKLSRPGSWYYFFNTVAEVNITIHNFQTMDYDDDVDIFAFNLMGELRTLLT